MANNAAAELSEEMQDEVWMIMHMVAEMGAHPEAKKDSQKKFLFECEAGSFDGIDVDGEEEHDAREKAMIDAAEKLTLMGDKYDEEQQQKRQKQKELEEEITSYLRGRAEEINKKYAEELGELRPSNVFKSELMGIVYSEYKTKLQNFLGFGQDVDKIAVVSSITKGVARSFQQSSSSTVHLVSTLASKFITDNYGGFIRENGGLTNLVSHATNGGGNV